MTRVASRHRLYYDLLDAFGQEGCPICRLGKLTVARYLDILAYENVNDPGVRDKLRAARGFCNYHAYQFLEEIRDLLAVGIIYRDVVNAVVLALPASGNGVLPRPVLALVRPTREEACEDHALVALLRPAGACPACKALDEGVSDRLHALLEHLPEPDFRAAYEGSSGLCHPHFLEALAEVRQMAELELLVRGGLTRLASQVGRKVEASDETGRAAVSRQLIAATRSSFGERGALARENQPSRAFSLTTRAEPTTQPEHARTASDPDTCPVCARSASRVAQAIASFRRGLSADVHHGVTQLELLCNRHAWQLAQSDPAGELGPVFDALLERRQSRLGTVAWPLLAQDSGQGGLDLPGRLPRARRLGRELAHQLGARRLCPLCERQAELELADLQEYAAELAEAEATSSPTGEAATLCLPHLSQSCHLRLSPGLRAALLRRQMLGWNRLVAELKEYIRKQDYRFRDEPRGHEQTSPYRAVAQMAGQRGMR